MKTLNLLNRVVLLVGAVLTACASANAQDTITLNLETGAVSSSTGLTSPPTPFIGPGALTSLTGFGASPSDPLYLSYPFSTETSPIDYASLVPEPGEIFIYDSTVHTPANLINVIGFLVDNPSYVVDVSLVPGTPGYLSGGLPADFVNFVGNFGEYESVSLTEGAGGVTTYTPTGQPQPGYIDDGGTPVTYNFDTPSGVPDGGTTLWLMGASMFVLGALKRRLHRN
jgi:hypothetical protein